MPLEGPGSEERDFFNELVESPCPPDDAIVFPEEKILGPGTIP